MKSLVKRALVLGAMLVLGAVACTKSSPPEKEPGGAVPPPARTRTITLAAASDLKFALDELIKDFHARHPGTHLEVTYGSSGNFLAQIQEGAPFDVYLSADVAYPRELASQGLVEGEVFTYAVGKLVVWVPKASPLPLEAQGLQVLLAPGVKHIAIANPRHAPYGRAAEAALKSQGLYDAVKDKLVLGENIAQTAQFVQSGNTDVGLIALSLALAPAMKDQGRYWEVPLEAYPRLEQGGAVLKRAKDLELARQVRDVLMGPEGKALLQRYGFSLEQAR